MILKTIMYMWMEYLQEVSVNSSINLTADVFANGNGDYTVSVRSVKNGKCQPPHR
ncbi:MAG: hypothetical protein ACLUR5_10880 [Eubacterium ventriosum]